MAATAFAEERTVRFDAIRAGLEDFHEVGVGAVFVIPPDPDPNPLASKGKGDEDDPSFAFRVMEGRIIVLLRDLITRGFEGNSSDTGTEVGEGIDGEFQLLVVGEGVGSEFAGWIGHALQVAFTKICE